MHPESQAAEQKEKSWKNERKRGKKVYAVSTTSRDTRYFQVKTTCDDDLSSGELVIPLSAIFQAGEMEN